MDLRLQKILAPLNLKLLVLTGSLSIACFSFCNLGASQELSIGVPLIEQPLNIVNADSAFSQLILFGATQPLLRNDVTKNGRAKLLLADSFSTSIDGKSVEIRLRSAASFINSKLVNESDLNASFDRCVSKPSSRFLTKFSIPPSFKVYSKEQRIFVSFEAQFSPAAQQSLETQHGQEAIFSFVENCPILEERSLKLFGQDLGSANLILGTGPYHLVLRIKNREARLERIAKINAWAVAINVRGFSDSGHGVTALQTGTIDALYTQDLEALTKARKDPTLLIEECGVYNIILRKGLEMNCFSFLDPGSVKYTTL